MFKKLVGSDCKEQTTSPLMPEQETTEISAIERLLNWANTPCHATPFWLHKLHSLLRIILITFKEFGNNALNIRASALTYTILLSLVPMLAMSTAVVKGLGGGNELRQLVYSYIDTLEETTPLTHVGIPGTHKSKEQTQTDAGVVSARQDTAITEHFRSAADQIFDYVDNTDFATLGTIGVLGVLLSAILVLSNIELSMNTIWHVHAGRSLLRKVTDYLTFLILMPLSINFGFAANAVLKNDALLNKLLDLLPGPWVQTGLLFLIPLFFITLTLFLIYIFFPNTKVKTGPAFIGALFAGSFWFFTQNIYIGLQIGVSKYNAIYGSFATLPLFLIWMFLGWVFILGGAQLAFACQQHHRYQLKKLNHSPLEQLSAAFDILNITYDFYANKTQLKTKELPAHCPAYSATLLFSSLKKLIASQTIVSTEKGRLLPSGPANKLQYQEIVSSILGNSFPDTRGGKAAAALLKQAKPLLDKDFSVKT
jgi:membrane protein